MTVFENRGRWERSNVEFQDGQVIAYDKSTPTSRMRHVDYGLSVFTRSAFDAVPEALDYDLETVFQYLIGRDELAAYEVGDRFYEIGSLKGIDELRRYLARGSRS